MNKFKFYFFLFCSVLILFSCNKSDSVEEIPVRDFDVQYLEDKALIEDFLNTHYLTGTNQGEEVEMPLITETNNFPSIMTLLAQADDAYPQLRKKVVEYNDKTYDIYYLKLRADNASATAIQPSRVDEVLLSYKGSFLNYVTEEVITKTDTISVTTLNVAQFEYVPQPSGFTILDQSPSIRGWAEIIPLFKSGDKEAEVVGQPTTYTNFGEGVMFVPSGFAYFNLGRLSPLSQITIPSYAPLVYTFKLLDAKAADQDADGILSNDEDLNHNGDFTDDDTDGDDVPNYYDADDDGDGYYTKNETRRPNIMIDGVSTPNGYYPFNGGVDDPDTENIDESQGVPNCSGNFIEPTRLRRYLDPSCH